MMQVADLNKKNIATLRAAACAGRCQAGFIEVMACEGGCISGPSAHNDSKSGLRRLNQELTKINDTYQTRK